MRVWAQVLSSPSEKVILLRFPLSFWIAWFNRLWSVNKKTGWQFFQNTSNLSYLWDLAFATMFICSALEWRKISTSSQNISFFWQTSFQGSWLVEPSCWRVLLQCFHCILQTLLTSLHFRTSRYPREMPSFPGKLVMCLVWTTFYKRREIFSAPEKNPENHVHLAKFDSWHQLFGFHRKYFNLCHSRQP